jgi:hypothetical protein
MDPLYPTPFAQVAIFLFKAPEFFAWALIPS